jgi:methyl-accepting chemotaxis protein
MKTEIPSDNDINQEVIQRCLAISPERADHVKAMAILWKMTGQWKMRQKLQTFACQIKDAADNVAYPGNLTEYQIVESLFDLCDISKELNQIVQGILQLKVTE